MSRLTSKGQVTIPKRLRDRLGLEPGSEVAFDYAGEGRVLLHRLDPARRALNEKERFERALEHLRGSAGPGPSTDEVMQLTRGYREPDYDVG